jgi:ubiquitin-protein ligase
MLPEPSQNACCMVRYNEENPGYCRAAVTGPGNSPYAFGFFIFDVYFPADYPLTPPLVQYVLTGGGTERMHYNIYSDGKVCVSLLGNTEGDSDERWNSKIGSLGQVLVSIQSLILGGNPLPDSSYPPPPGIGPISHKDSNSGDHWYHLRHATIRLTMLDVIQDCLYGFANKAESDNSKAKPCKFPDMMYLIRAHFLNCRQSLLTSLKAEWNTLRSHTLTEDSRRCLENLTLDIKKLIELIAALEKTV